MQDLEDLLMPQSAMTESLSYYDLLLTWLW